VERNVWRKSSRSGSNGQCVEVRNQGNAVQVRDSKNPTETILTFNPDEWRAFLDGAKSGEFDIS